MRLIVVLVMMLNVPSANALTWREFWEPFTEHSHTYHPRIRNKVVTCYKHIRYEEYIAGNSHSSGYVRHHHEKYKIPCY